MAQNEAGSGRNVNLKRAAAPAELSGRGEVFGIAIETSMTAVFGGVRVEKDLVFAGFGGSNSIVGITVGPVEVEDKNGAGAIENDHFVTGGKIGENSVKPVHRPKSNVD